MATMAATIRWATNIEDLRAQLKSGQDAVFALESAAEKTARALGGEGLIRAANNAAAAVEKLGGTSKLTTSEQERLATMTEKALAKYQALGQSAPSAIRNLAESTRAAVTESKRLDDEVAAVQRHVAAFNGSKVTSEANQMAKAIQQIGGADKLTAAEQKAVNATVSEAIAKYHSLGQEAPAALLQIQTATKAIPPIPDPTVAFKKQIGELQGTLNAAASGFRTAGVGMTAAFTVPIVAAGAAIFKLGVDAVESESLVSVSFGDMRKSADEWSKGLSDSLGLNQFEMRKMAGVLFTMTTGMGLTRDASFEMSTGLSRLAADMASFRNISIDEAFTKLRAGITGETEPLKALGILVDEATVKTYAYSTGIAKQGAELTQQQKVLARYQAILAQTKNDQGDLARTIDSPANQLRLFRTRVEEAATSLGIALLPLIQRAVGALTSLVPVVQNVVQWFIAMPQPVQFVVVAVALLVAGIGPLLILLGTLASSIATLLPLLPALGVSASTAATGVLTLSGALSTLTLTGGVVIALAGIAAGIYKVVEAYKAWKSTEMTTFEFLTQKEDDNWLRRLLGLTDKTALGFEKVHTSAKDLNLTLEAMGASGAKSLTPFTDALASARKELDALKKSSPATYADALKGVQSGAFDMTALKSVTGLSEEALKMLQQEVRATKKEMHSGFLFEFQNGLKKLTGEVDSAVSHHMSMTEQVKLFGSQASKTAAEARGFGVSVSASVQDVADAFDVLKNNKAVDEMAADWAKVQESFTKGSDKVFDHWMDAERKAADASAANMVKLLGDREKYQSRVNEIGLTGLQLNLKHIDDARNAEIKSLGLRTDQNARFWDENKPLIDAYYAHEQHLALGTFDTIEERMARQGVLTKAQLQDVAAAATRDYEQMKASGLFTYDELATAANRSADAQKAANRGLFDYILGELDKIARSVESAFSKIADSTGGIVSRIAGSIAGIAKAWNEASAAVEAYAQATTTAEKAAALAQMGAAFTSATDPRGKTATQTALSGAASGAKIGSIAGPYGMAIGAGVGALVGWWRSAHAEWRKVAKDIGKDIGVDISQGLAQQIADLEKTIVGGTKDQRRKWAEALSLDSIIEEAGGLNSSNLRKFERQAASLFEPIQRGGQLGADATKKLNDLIGQFADQAEKTGGLWDPVFKSLIAKSKELGLNLESVTAAIDKQIAKLSGGLSAAVKGAFAGTDTGLSDIVKGLAKDEAAALDDAFKHAQESGFKGTINDYFAQQAKLYQTAQEGDPRLKTFFYGDTLTKFDTLTAGAQAAFDRLSRIALASFNTIVASGKSAFEAISDEGVGQAVDELIAQHERLGLAGGAAYDQLARFRDLAKNNQELVASVGGLNDVLTALANLGGLNADTLADLEAQGLDTFAKLQAAGFTENEALQQMVPFLKGVIQAHVDLGVPIDENTQKLIDQADAAGLLGDDTMSMLDILKEGFAALIEAVGGKVPDAFRKMAKSAKDAAGDATDAINRIPKTVEISVKYPGLTPGEIPEGADDRMRFATGGMVPDANAYAGGGKVLAFATGGRVPEVPKYLSTGEMGRLINFVPKGTDTVPAMLTPGEVVLNAAQQENLADLITSRNRGVREERRTGTDDRGVTIILERDGRKEAEFIVPYIPGVVKRYGLA